MCPQAIAYLIPEELFKMELEEGVERVQRTLHVFQAFKHTYQLYRGRLSGMGPYSQQGRLVKPWDFPSQIIFQRTERITERLLMIEVSDYKGTVFSADSSTLMDLNLQSAYLGV